MTDQPRIQWYRSPIERSDLRELTKKSDTRGLIMAGGYTLVMALLGAAFYVASSDGLVLPALVAYFCYGMVFAFLVNGFHELVHGTVFKSPWLNNVFLYFFSFLFWGNPHHFRESHMRHHMYTLHPPDDLEVRLPVVFRPRDVVLHGIVDLPLIWWTLKTTARTALGIVDMEWDLTCFPEEAKDKRRQLFLFARILLVGHTALTAGALLIGAWQIPLLITFAFPFARWLHILCNQTQHAGLAENTTDYRISARSIMLNPLVEFLYWHMNYHIEHHMYASVPCYNLPALNRKIRSDLPAPSRGLLATWRHIFAILDRQRTEPEYVFTPELPART